MFKVQCSVLMRIKGKLDFFFFKRALEGFPASVDVDIFRGRTNCGIK